MLETLKNVRNILGLERNILVLCTTAILFNLAYDLYGPFLSPYYESGGAPIEILGRFPVTVVRNERPVGLSSARNARAGSCLKMLKDGKSLGEKYSMVVVTASFVAMHGILVCLSTRLQAL